MSVLPARLARRLRFTEERGTSASKLKRGIFVNDMPALSGA